MSVVTKITDHKARIWARVISQFRSVPEMQILMDAISDEVQVVEDAFYDLYTRKGLNGWGDQLDQVGKLFAETRDGDSDAVYKIRIFAKRRALRSSGTSRDVLGLFKILLPSSNIVLDDWGGGGYIVRLGQVLAQYLATYARLLKIAKDAGANAQIVYWLQDESTIFKFGAASAGTVIDTSRGLGTVTNSTGGHLAGVVKA